MYHVCVYDVYTDPDTICIGRDKVSVLHGWICIGKLFINYHKINVLKLRGALIEAGVPLYVYLPVHCSVAVLVLLLTVGSLLQ